MYLIKLENRDATAALEREAFHKAIQAFLRQSRKLRSRSIPKSTLGHS